jgi:hypothetical protein
LCWIASTHNLFSDFCFVFGRDEHDAVATVASSRGDGGSKVFGSRQRRLSFLGGTYGKVLPVLDSFPDLPISQRCIATHFEADTAIGDFTTSTTFSENFQNFF